ncbi:septal ring lytic transglycosylase RlpA family protein [Stenotrophomonas oahuensis]|uniref:Endolytic peptidoglycan transglycosylase RlpA n=1 Tax=Stenotrophomonas oahuensis TaxID=3003271 RepID=A0ABY9YRW6_9GAMM|nr:septal ring lytic transglycosylase RlpA family protein [Stenotrophomonas sp. A5586]WNH53467.1 septal ring lytic transglycosylase RlpA family protein [Stenotrophomonas sp. A5586]
MNTFAQCRGLMVGVLVLALAACSSAPKKPASAGGSGKSSGALVQGKGGSNRPSHCPEGSPYQAATEDPNTRGNYRAGGLYKPGVNDSTPTYVPDVACIPEPDVVDLPRSAVGNKSPYVVLGKQYQVMDKTKGYAEKGTASYYGSKFHGRLTSNREVYDMYAFTAAHKTLPLPSFARVTNLDNGESVVVRVNDRGPFHDGRVIDLSYAAAVRLGITQRGTGNVEVRALQPGEEPLLAAKPSRREQRAAQAATAAAPAPARPSDMDRLVGALPAASPATGNRPSAATQAASLDTGPVSVSELPPAAPVRPAPVVATAPAANPTLSQQMGTVLLQVASFASRDNATRALGQLSTAGIVGASISDIVSGGRTLWRLRVPASDHASAAELAGRIVGLGFGSPQIVKE